MILDKIENLYKYECLSEYSNKIVDFINNYEQNDMPDGKYELQGDELFALVQRYNTKAEAICKPESHKQYIDLQYISKGREKILWDLVGELSVAEDSTPEKDFILYEKGSTSTILIMRDKMFAIFFSHDAHTPCVTDKEQSFVEKIVFKIKVTQNT